VGKGFGKIKNLAILFVVNAAQIELGKKGETKVGLPNMGLACEGFLCCLFCLLLSF
jgi:hypothetical protein